MPPVPSYNWSTGRAGAVAWLWGTATDRWVLQSLFRTPESRRPTPAIRHTPYIVVYSRRGWNESDVVSWNYLVVWLGTGRPVPTLFQARTVQNQVQFARTHFRGMPDTTTKPVTAPKRKCLQCIQPHALDWRGCSQGWASSDPPLTAREARTYTGPFTKAFTRLRCVQYFCDFVVSAFCPYIS